MWSYKGGSTTDEFIYPLVFFQKSQVMGKTIQMVDSLNQNLRFEPLSERDIGGVTYVGYFINFLLAPGEELVFTIEVG